MLILWPHLTCTHECHVCILCLAVFLLNDAASSHVDILSLVSVAHVVEKARLVDVDGAATGRKEDRLILWF